ncbi:hypothetical protein M408DRAFT_298791 [Serendipita vermifera MAFF 305830]|uniref:Uncharacterized protein n=1 Tax=Serendipita vermifera MAFF 305830 TaxID=933852 RepID=A0A0C3ABE6_SERVB|nr:hypothetical protein M408DRAFT_298791 [Serendipita vermifera MAFF 305830]
MVGRGSLSVTRVPPSPGYTQTPLWRPQRQPRTRRKLQRHLWHSARFSNIAYTYLIFKLSVIFLETTNGTCAGILVVFPPGNRILYSLKKKNPHLKTLHIIHHGRFVSFMFLLYGYRLCSRSTLVAAHPRITAYPISPLHLSLRRVVSRFVHRHFHTPLASIKLGD